MNIFDWMEYHMEKEDGIGLAVTASLAVGGVLLIYLGTLLLWQ